MVQGLLFKWEDSPALRHHCGFCDRPLSHPGARSSCFGTHAEPCHRFHQALFMRLRAHTCAYCLSIDEAHYKRHKDIAEQLLGIYEICNEIDWSIIPFVPNDGHERGGDLEAHTAENEETDQVRITEDTGSSKRANKMMKRMAKVSNRPKVGEKFTSNSSEFNAVMLPAQKISVIESKQEKKRSMWLLPSSHNTDQRHLENIHKRVTGDDGCRDSVIEPHQVPSIPVLPELTPDKKAISLKIVNTDAAEATTKAMGSAWEKKNARRQLIDGWEVVSQGKKSHLSTVKTAAETGSILHQDEFHRTESACWNANESDFPRLPAAHLPSFGDAKSKTASHASTATPVIEPDDIGQCEVASDGSIDNSKVSQHTLSQKKKTKKAREAKRKARKAAAQAEDTDTSTLSGDVSRTLNKYADTVISDSSTLSHSDNHKKNVAQESTILNSIEAESVESVTGSSTIEVCTSISLSKPSEDGPSRPPALLPVTNYGKHSHWTNFTRTFIVDQLTGPQFSWLTCPHGGGCVFEANSVLDCPFHEPYCLHDDPLDDLCYLVYPSDALCSSGPYNRLRGEKLLDLYERDDRTKGKLMLLDEDLVFFLIDDPQASALSRATRALPARLAAEYADTVKGYCPGPQMQQEHQFNRLVSRNNHGKQRISRDLLQDIQRQVFESHGSNCICYCESALPRKDESCEDLIVCSHRDCEIVHFHKSCVKHMGVDRVSRWFCSMCDGKIKSVARQTLRDLGYTDVLVDEDDHYSCCHGKESRIC